MPELSRFFGIIIRTFIEAGAKHHVAHFHAYGQNEVGVFSIEPVEMIAAKAAAISRSRRLIGLACKTDCLPPRSSPYGRLL
jgi:hypothetical protein